MVNTIRPVIPEAQFWFRTKVLKYSFQLINFLHSNYTVNYDKVLTKNRQRGIFLFVVTCKKKGFVSQLRDDHYGDRFNETVKKVERNGAAAGSMPNGGISGFVEESGFIIKSGFIVKSGIVAIGDKALLNVLHCYVGLKQTKIFFFFFNLKFWFYIFVLGKGKK
jgi:hypothetical protein